MNGINISINNAINRYSQANGGFKKTNTIGQTQAVSSEKTAEAWKRSFDGFERTQQSCGKSTSDNNKGSYANYPQSNSSWENVRRFDGFDAAYSTTGSYKTKQPAKTDDVIFCPADSEESKKAKELSDAYAYFRRAAKSNG